MDAEGEWKGEGEWDGCRCRLSVRAMNCTGHKGDKDE
jgi:hypothetical protein